MEIFTETLPLKYEVLFLNATISVSAMQSRIVIWLHSVTCSVGRKMTYLMKTFQIHSDLCIVQLNNTILYEDVLFIFKTEI